MGKVTINFGGFYGSIHDSIVEQQVAYSLENGVDDNGNINNDVLFDVLAETWKKAQNSYANKWLNNVLNYELETSFKFDCIDSPRFYNYSTDVIIADYIQEDFNKTIEYINNEGLKDEVTNIVSEITTSRSGYIPFYSKDEVLSDNDLYLECMLDVVIEHLIYEDKNNYFDFEWSE